MNQSLHAYDAPVEVLEIVEKGGSRARCRWCHGDEAWRAGGVVSLVS